MCYRRAKESDMLLVIGTLVLCASTLGAVQKKATLKGSPASQERQNTQGEAEELSRLSDTDLEHSTKNELLVPIPENNTIRVDPRLEKRFRYIRPWTEKFLLDLGKAFYGRFKKPVQINSAVRTLEHQRRLRRRNPNAAKTSSHLFGSTVDIAKISMRNTERAWMRAYLLRLEREDFVEATEEHRQAVFHVMVFKKYADASHNIP